MMTGIKFLKNGADWSRKMGSETFSGRESEAQAEENREEALPQDAAEAIRTGENFRARCILRKAVSENMENPEAYNLLGISYEKEGDRIKASKFYRVAYYMDQTFKAASDNLDRVCGFWYKGAGNIAWGLKSEEVKKR
mgnify:FL=1